jgi:hypothetical protein
MDARKRVPPEGRAAARHLFGVRNSSHDRGNESRSDLRKIARYFSAESAPAKVPRRGATVEGTRPLLRRRSATRKSQFEQPRP